MKFYIVYCITSIFECFFIIIFFPLLCIENKTKTIFSSFIFIYLLSIFFWESIIIFLCEKNYKLYQAHSILNRSIKTLQTFTFRMICLLKLDQVWTHLWNARPICHNNHTICLLTITNKIPIISHSVIQLYVTFHSVSDWELSQMTEVMELETHVRRMPFTKIWWLLWKEADCDDYYYYLLMHFF